jgi:Flp pilus assembly protein TadD
MKAMQGALGGFSIESARRNLLRREIVAPRVSPANVNLAKNVLSDLDPMVRIGALDMLEGVPASQIWPLVSPLLADSSRGVRIKAVELLAAVPPASQPPVDREKFERAAAEFVTAQRFNADRPESRSRLGSFYARRGLTVDAEAEYRTALRLSPQYAPAAINLADLYRQLGRDSEGESILRAAITASSGDAGLHYALGLTLTRLKRSTEALGELRQATELDRESARYAYVYGVALHSGGHLEEAMVVLKDNLVRHPDNRDTLLALISYNRDAGDFKSALRNAEYLARISPGDRELAHLIADLRRRTNASDAQQ